MDKVVTVSLPKARDVGAKAKSKKEFPFAIGCPALIWQVIFFYLPLFFMVITSVIHFSVEGNFQGLTFSHFLRLFNATHMQIIFQSLGTAFLTSILCFSVAFPFAYFIAFKGGRYKSLFLIFLIIPFWSNFLMHVCAWFFVLEKNGFLNNFLLHLNFIDKPVHFLNSYFSVMLLMIYHYLPFMILPIYSSLEKFNMSLFEVSSDLGASWLQTFRKVMLPLTMPAIRLGFLLVYIPSFGEFVIPELMGGDKNYMVGNVVTQYMLGDRTGPIGAAFTVLSCFFLVLSILVFLSVTKKISSYLKGSFSQ